MSADLSSPGPRPIGLSTRVCRRAPIRARRLITCATTCGPSVSRRWPRSKCRVLRRSVRLQVSARASAEPHE
eukprot:1713049-Pyramimonas_sp.AAC.1